MKLFRHLFKLSRKLKMLSVIAAACMGLTSCVVSPYNGQKFESLVDEIPITIWTPDKVTPITIECAKGTESGVPYFGEIYRPVTTILPAGEGVTDSNGVVVYLASKEQIIPAICWRYSPSTTVDDDYNFVTALRFTQGDVDDLIFTFDEAGLECWRDSLGIGTASESWTRWIGRDCHRVTFGAPGPRKELYIRAKGA